MLAMKDVAMRMGRCEKLCNEAQKEYRKIHVQLNLADFYTPEQLKWIWGPCGAAVPSVVPFQQVPGQNVWMQRMPFQQVPMDLVRDDDSRASSMCSNLG